MHAPATPQAAPHPHARSTHDDRDRLAVADEVAAALPAVALNDGGRRAGVVHRVRRHDVVAVRRPVEAQHLRRAPALQQRDLYTSELTDGIQRRFKAISRKNSRPF